MFHLVVRIVTWATVELYCIVIGFINLLFKKFYGTVDTIIIMLDEKDEDVLPLYLL